MTPERLDPWAGIPLDEFRLRQSWLCELLSAADLPVAIVISRGGGGLDMCADVLWLANHYIPGPYVGDEAGLGRSRTHAALVISASGDVTAVSDIRDIREDLVVADRIDVDIDIPRRIAELVRELGADRARILLVGTSYMSARTYLSLRQELPHVQFVVDDAFVKHMRRIKSPAEQQMLREAARLGDSVVNAVIDAVIEGATEAEAAAMGALEVFRRGGALWDINCASGPFADRYTWTRLPAADAVRTFNKGEIFHVDCYGAWGGYLFDVARSRCVGDEPDDRQCAMLEAPISVVESICAAIGPGSTCAELAEVGLEAERAASSLAGYRYDPNSFPAFGHGLGLSWEGPYLLPDDHTALQPGTCLAIESRLGCAGFGSAAFEQTGIVTEEGFELISHAHARSWKP